MQRFISQLPSHSHTIFDPRNRYITHLQYTVLSPEDRDSVFIYPTMFYVSLSNEKLPARRVARRPKAVNIFSKDILVFPICENSHWFLIVVVKPGLVTTPDKTNNNGEPMLVVMDSLGLSQDSAVKLIREYLTQEWRTSPSSGGQTFQFSAKHMRTIRPQKVRISTL